MKDQYSQSREAINQPYLLSHACQSLKSEKYVEFLPKKSWGSQE